MLGVDDQLPEALFDETAPFKSRPTLVVWLRHFGCRFYQEAKVKLPALRKRLGEHGIDLACVVQGTREEAAIFWPFPDIGCIPDPAKQSYELIGLERTSLLKILFPNRELKARRAEVSALGCSVDRKGTTTKSSDVLQLPGLALIDANRRILWVHRGRSTGDLDLSEGLADRMVAIARS